MESWSWMVGFLMFLLLFYVIGTWNYGTFRNRNIEYLTPKLPFFGNVWPIFSGKKSYPEVVIDLYNHGKSSGCCGMFEFTRPFILLCNAEVIKNTVLKHFEIFPGNRIALFEDLDPTLVKGLFALSGERWKEARHHLTPMFTASKLKTQFKLLQECAQYSCKYLEEKLLQHEMSSSGDRCMELDCKDFFMKFSPNTITSIAYGLNINHYENADNEIRWCANHFLESGINNVFRIVGYLLWPKLFHKLRISLLSKKFHQTMINCTRRGLSERMADGTTRPDMVQHLLAMKTQAEKYKYEDVDLAGLAATFFIAGFESVSTVLYFACYRLAIHPDLQRRVQQELDEILENTNGELTYENISELKYLEMFLQETLRMHPTLLTIDRVCEKTCSFPISPNKPPLVVKAGEVVVIPIYALHHDPEYFPEPYKFDPERFNQENIKNIQPCTYIPFGITGRKCIGDRFSRLEVKLLLATLLLRFSFSAVSSTPIPMVFKKRNITMVPQDGFVLGVTSRKN